jgi:ribosomal protein S1
MREGEIIEVKITAVHQFGIEVDASGECGFIQPVEVNWIPEKASVADFQVGQLIKVLVYSITPSRFFASIKRAAPEVDPWRDSERYCVGSRHSGTIVAVVDWGYKVSIAEGVCGMMLNTTAGARYHVGEQVVAEVSSVNPRQRKIELKPVPVA